MLRCSKEAFAACPTAHICGRREDSTFTEGSECDKFNQKVAESCKLVITNGDRIRAMSDEELERLLTEIVYGREEPWSLPFEKACCDTCPTVKGTVVETGQKMEFTECDFTDGKCPHGDAVKWWLNQPVNQTRTDDHEDKQHSGLLED